MKLFGKKRGRTPDFKCSICGKFVSYDRRTILIRYNISCGYTYDGDPYPIEEIEMMHKKCVRRT